MKSEYKKNQIVVYPSEKQYEGNHAVVYPSEEQMNQQINSILDKSRIKKRSALEMIRATLIGPGLSVVFYRFKLILLGSFLIYLFLAFLCQQLAYYVEIENKEYMMMLLFPMLHLVFQSLSLWSEEQEELVELKCTLHYSFSYLVGLRMFYITILSALLNLLTMLRFTGWQNMGKLCAIGFSSMFLFTVITLVMCEHVYRYFHVFGLAVFWAVLCVLLARYGSGISYILFELLPLTVHIAMAAVSFGLLLYYMGKVGRSYAYTCEGY